MLNAREGLNGVQTVFIPSPTTHGGRLRIPACNQRRVGTRRVTHRPNLWKAGW
jgi:hypothetical protein